MSKTHKGLIREQTRLAARLWNETLTADPVREDIIQLKYSESEFAEPVLPFATGSGAFALTCTRSAPFYYDEDEGTAWIMAAGFRDRESMDDMLDKQFAVLESRGVRKVVFSGFTPTYFLPGIDTTAYPWLAEYVKSRGFVQTDEALAMDKELWPSLGELPESVADGVGIDDIKRSDIGPLLEMIKKNFPADYYHRAKVVAERGEHHQIKVAREAGEVIGYSMFFGTEGRRWFMPGEHFGPFGVDGSHRNRGIGAALLAETLREMKARGLHRAYFLWTGEKASRLYARFGFRVTRRFSVLEAVL